MCHLDLPSIGKCAIDLKLADCSITNAYGRVNNVIIELHMNFVPVDFIIITVGSTPFWRHAADTWSKVEKLSHQHCRCASGMTV
jgi:hypothetical protein